jgi:hypothetical protein
MIHWQKSAATRFFRGCWGKKVSVKPVFGKPGWFFPRGKPGAGKEQIQPRASFSPASQFFGAEKSFFSLLDFPIF